MQNELNTGGTGRYLVLGSVWKKIGVGGTGD